MDTNITIDADANTALATISTSLPTILAADQNDILGKLAAKVAAFVSDISTAKGRKASASLAAEVATSKMDLVRLANGMMEADRKRINAILAERKIIEDRMDALKAHVRADLTAYEEHQKAVERANEDALAAIEALAVGLADLSSAEIKQRSHQLAVIAEFDWSPEFAIRASKVQNGVIAQLEAACTKAVWREADAIAEAARQAEEAERARLAAIEAQRVREERIADEARLAAEAKAAAEAEAACVAAQRADYHRAMLQHVKDCGFGIIGGQVQSFGILQYELQEKIKFDEEIFGALLPEALTARDHALSLIQQAMDERAKRNAQTEALERAEREKAAAEETARHVAARAEASRVQAHQDAMAILRKLATPLAPPDPVPVIDAKIRQLDDVYGRDWEEFADEAHAIHGTCKEALHTARTASLKAEADRALERDRIAADRAEITRKAEAAQAAREQAAAVEAATLAEQRRAAAVEAAERAEAEKRAANVAHRKRINGEALTDMVAAMSEVHMQNEAEAAALAKAIITAIAKGTIRHTTISY